MFWSVVVALGVFLGGLEVARRSEWAVKDPLEGVSGRTAETLQQLVQTKYFRIIRLNVNEECPLGLMKRICKSKSCTVCRCNDKDIPESWTNTEKVKTHTHHQDLWADERSDAKKGWVWHVEDEANDRGEYFDIHSNIESFTNYNGSSIWKLVYEENCFRGPGLLEEMCMEEKILYKIISGLHTSISTHLSRFYKDSPEQNPWADLRSPLVEQQFHFNASEYQRRVLQHPDRIQNLMFLYRLLGRAVALAAPYLRTNFTVQSDNLAEDIRAEALLLDLLRELQGLDLLPEENQELRFFKAQNPHVRQYQRYIHNISEILNCVECEKCRLFGKMQTYGVGTALKILLGYPTPYKRNQIVALFNVFNKVSVSVSTYYQHRQQRVPLGHERTNTTFLDTYKFLAGLLLLFWLWNIYHRQFILPQEGGRKEE